jgi:hypothetical protein
MEATPCPFSLEADAPGTGPDWIPGVPWEPGTGIGSPNVNMTLFNFEGAALPSVGIFQNPAAICEREAPGSVPCVVGG